LVGVILAFGELQHTEFLKASFFWALKWAISPVLSDQIMYIAKRRDPDILPYRMPERTSQ